jgi:hypothetical protein
MTMGSNPRFTKRGGDHDRAETATVRVLRSTGFDDTVVAEGDVDLSYTDRNAITT